jgi:hypothetical protein
MNFYLCHRCPCDIDKIDVVLTWRVVHISALERYAKMTVPCKLGVSALLWQPADTRKFISITCPLIALSRSSTLTSNTEISAMAKRPYDMTEEYTTSGSIEGESSKAAKTGIATNQPEEHASAESDVSDIEGITHRCAPEFKNDLMESMPNPSSVDFAQIAKLSKYKFTRAKAMDWAMNDMKYLVYDDTDIKVKGYDSDDEDSDRKTIKWEDDVEELPAASSSKKADNGQPCRICPSYPEFPHSWKPRKFRLVNPTVDHPEDGHPVDLCQHYIAVSYCWPPYGEDVAPRTYEVRDLDGKVRQSRALDDVLDRAVDVANTCGVRMIWIDQECLPQPTEESSAADQYEQELGVQAMDIVYNRAIATAGMLDVIVDTQAQLDALEAMMFFDKARIEEMVNYEFCHLVLDILYRTSLDRWYTRAWVVQESFCAGKKLVLVYRRGEGLKFPSTCRMGYKHETMTRPYHSLDDSPRQRSSNIVCVPLQSFWDMIDAMKYFLNRDFFEVGTWLMRSDAQHAYAIPEAQAAIEVAESLHPRAIGGNTILQVMKIYGKGNYGKRPTVNAAGALTLLKNRQCHLDCDRIAIMANMCDYDFRLDTRAIGQNCSSLRQAILALALNNGDLSLLVPEVYMSESNGDPSQDYNITSNESCLFAEIHKDAAHIEYCRVRDILNFKIQSTRPGRVTSAGLQMPAYIWSVGTFANFRPIQARWADTWDTLKCWRIVVDRMKNETWKQFQLRQMAITRRFSEPGVGELASLEFKVAGHIPNESVIWRGIDPQVYTYLAT